MPRVRIIRVPGLWRGASTASRMTQVKWTVLTITDSNSNQAKQCASRNHSLSAGNEIYIGLTRPLNKLDKSIHELGKFKTSFCAKVRWTATMDQLHKFCWRGHKWNTRIESRMRRNEQLFLLWQSVIFFNKQLIKSNKTRWWKSSYNGLYFANSCYLHLLIQSIYVWIKFDYLLICLISSCYRED